MLIILVALLIAGNTIKWYWFLAAFLFDTVWLSIKLNFLAVLIRRSIEDAKEP